MMTTHTEHYQKIFGTGIVGNYPSDELFNLIKGREAQGWSVRWIERLKDATLVVYEVPPAGGVS